MIISEFKIFPPVDTETTRLLCWIMLGIRTICYYYQPYGTVQTSSRNDPCDIQIEMINGSEVSQGLLHKSVWNSWNHWIDYWQFFFILSSVYKSYHWNICDDPIVNGILMFLNSNANEIFFFIWGMEDCCRWLSECDLKLVSLKLVEIVEESPVQYQRGNDFS